MRYLVGSFFGSAALAFLASAAYGHTLSGTLVYKGADDALVAKSGEVEFDAADLARVKLKISDHSEQLAEKVKVYRLETENRTVVIAAFRNVRDMPEDTTLIVKANVLEGTNGKVLYGDIFTRQCEKGYAAQLSDQESALDRLMFAVRERKGCEITYRGGILLSAIVDQAQQSQQTQQDQDNGQG